MLVIQRRSVLWGNKANPQWQTGTNKLMDGYLCSIISFCWKSHTSICETSDHCDPKTLEIIDVAKWKFWAVFIVIVGEIYFLWQLASVLSWTNLRDNALKNKEIITTLCVPFTTNFKAALRKVTLSWQQWHKSRFLSKRQLLTSVFWSWGGFMIQFFTCSTTTWSLCCTFGSVCLSCLQSLGATLVPQTIFTMTTSDSFLLEEDPWFSYSIRTWPQQWFVECPVCCELMGVTINKELNMGSSVPHNSKMVPCALVIIQNWLGWCLKLCEAGSTSCDETLNCPSAYSAADACCFFIRPIVPCCKQRIEFSVHQFHWVYFNPHHVGRTTGAQVRNQHTRGHGWGVNVKGIIFWGIVQNSHSILKRQEQLCSRG